MAAMMTAASTEPVVDGQAAHDISSAAALASEAQRFENRYVLEEEVGRGTYGAVFRGVCTRTNRTVAVKKMKPVHEGEGVPSTAIREVAVLKNCEHQNIVKLLDVVCSVGRVHLVFEFVDHTLKEEIRRYGPILTRGRVQFLQGQLLQGVDFCHSHRVIHRDLKPQNILVDEHGSLKIADFGMARAFSVPVPRYTHEVVTTWYRAPEILFGCKMYALPIDCWSTGCIFAELATSAALFRGDSEIDTIFQIFRKLGTPSEAEWPGLSKLPDFKPTFPQWKRRPWAEIRNTQDQLSQEGVALLDGLLRYDPRLRTSARQALESPYFQIDFGDQAPGATRGDARNEQTPRSGAVPPVAVGAHPSRQSEHL